MRSRQVGVVSQARYLQQVFPLPLGAGSGLPIFGVAFRISFLKFLLNLS
jgi:hypothetical protein